MKMLSNALHRTTCHDSSKILFNPVLSSHQSLLLLSLVGLFIVILNNRGNLRNNLTVRHVRVTIVAVEKQ